MTPQTPFQSEALLLARESRGLTQRQLAELSGCAQASISKAENGSATPSEESVAAWARALNYPVGLLGRNVRPVLTTFWRKRVTVPKSVSKQVQAELSLRAHHLEVLTRAVEPPEADIPQYSGEAPEEAAQQLRRYWRLSRGPIDNMVELLEDRGAVVLPFDFRNRKVFGCSFCNRDLPPAVFYNQSMPTDNNRFSNAHELGHLVLHQHGSNKDDVEDEANAFAVEFLMPSSEIRNDIPTRLHVEDLGHLKLRWRCSIASLIMRAKSLRRISDHNEKSLWIEYSSRGMRNNEPNALEPEVPRLFREMLDAHLDDLHFTPELLASSLGLTEAEFRTLYMPEAPVPGPRLQLVR